MIVATRPLSRVGLLLVGGALLGGCSAAGRGGSAQGRPPADSVPDAGADAAGAPVDAAGAPSDFASSNCQAPATPAGPEVELAPPFAGLYKVYALGSVPGVPNPLGGVVVKASDPTTLLVAGNSENASGALYAIHVNRDGCGHILSFNGSATKVADTPYVDANLVNGPQGLVLYSEWPQFKLGQLAAAATTPSLETDLNPIGIEATGDSGPGGLGYVPSGVMAAAGQLRMVTWPAGRWYHVAMNLNGALYNFSSVTKIVELPNNPGGFAYVPAGSPGFPKQSIIVAEWSQTGTAGDRVAVYEADANGDPLIASRREFLAKFPRPWGAYFEPLTGDYFFMTWGAGDDRIYVVQGFVPPPDPIF